jgi:hypothetical protein
VKCLTHQLQLYGKKILLLVITRVAIYTYHHMHGQSISMFKIPIRGYLIIIREPSSTLKTLKQANLIVIDEMSMMASILL